MDADSGPDAGPVEMTVMSAQMTAFRVSFTAGFSDLLNRSFPEGDYDLEDFPGLAEL